MADLLRRNGYVYNKKTAPGFERMRRQGAILPPVRIESKLSKKVADFWLKDLLRIFDSDESLITMIKNQIAILQGAAEGPGYVKNDELIKSLTKALLNAREKFFEDFLDDASDILGATISFSLDKDEVFRNRIDGLTENYFKTAMEKIYEGKSQIRKNFIDRLQLFVEGGEISFEDIIDQTKKEAGTFSKFFARDQFSRFNNALTLTCYKQGGAEYVKWLTCGDQRVRNSHRVMNKKIFHIDQVPEEKKDYLCRCALVPVFEDVKEVGYISGVKYYAID